MTYKENFVAAVKVNGKILRETGDTVHVPFGSEYALFLKNMNAVRTMVKVSVDGQDATEGTSLILPANGSIDLERFIRNGNRNSGNRFKFIERTAGIEEHRGIGGEDGLIRVEYHAEKIVQKQTLVTEHVHHHQDRFPGIRSPFDWPYQDPFRPYNYGINAINANVGQTEAGPLPRPYNGPIGPYRTGDLQRNGRQRRGAQRSNGPSGQSRGGWIGAMTYGGATQTINTAVTASNYAAPAVFNDAGITVAGSQSNQQFTSGAWFPTEEHGHVLVLRLRGVVGDKPVVRAITVDVKPKCVTCGRQNKAVNRFCAQCGTALQMI